MRQDEGRAWRGACETFAMLAAQARDTEIGICISVSTAKKTRIMRDKRHLTTACRESSHPFPCVHRLQQEPQHFARASRSLPGHKHLLRWTSTTSEGQPQEGSRAHSRFEREGRTINQESATQHPAVCAWSQRGSDHLFHSFTRKLPAQPTDPVLSEGYSPCGTPIAKAGKDLSFTQEHSSSQGPRCLEWT